MDYGENEPIRFGDFEFDSHSGKLFLDGRSIKIQPQPLRVLAVLLEKPGQIVSREQLRTRVWGDATFVEFDQGLNYCIRQIRVALSDGAAKPVYIETLPKQGYRFIARVLLPAERLDSPHSELWSEVSQEPEVQARPAESRLRRQEREPELVFGRERELSKLGELLQSAVDGTGRVALVTGEPGIGKTALAASFVYAARKRHPDLLLVRGACVEQYGAGEPYLVFLDALGGQLRGPDGEGWVALLRRFAPTWCLQFPAEFSSAVMEQLHREAIGATKDRMVRELADAFAAFTLESPILLVLEDVHWVDPASVDMLRQLAERASTQRLMILATARPEDIERVNPTLKKCYTEMHARGVCEEIALAPLKAPDVADYLNAHYSPNEFPPELVGLIHRKSEGHPLFATGAIQILAERGDILRDNGAWRLKPTPVADRTGRAGDDAQRNRKEGKSAQLTVNVPGALVYASIEGEEFTSTVLAALLDADDLELEERLHTIEAMHRLDPHARRRGSPRRVRSPLATGLLTRCISTTFTTRR